MDWQYWICRKCFKIIETVIFLGMGTCANLLYTIEIIVQYWTCRDVLYSDNCFYYKSSILLIYFLINSSFTLFINRVPVSLFVNFAFVFLGYISVTVKNGFLWKWIPKEEVQPVILIHHTFKSVFTRWKKNIEDLFTSFALKFICDQIFYF